MNGTVQRLNPIFQLIDTYDYITILSHQALE